MFPTTRVALVAFAAAAIGLSPDRGWDGDEGEATASSSPAAAAANGTHLVTARISTGSPVATVSDTFLSFAIDSSQVVGGYWWSKSGAPEGALGRHRTQPFDFDRPALRPLARALAPAYLRIGGSEADKLHYDLTDRVAPVATEGGNVHVLTKDQWDGLNRFAQAAGLRVMFTLAAGPVARDAHGAWSPESARPLVAYTHARGYPVDVWELGNENNVHWMFFGPAKQPSPEELAFDLQTLRSLVKGIDPAARIAGPAVIYWPRIGEIPSALGSAHLLEQTLAHANGAADIVTWHYYPSQSRRCTNLSFARPVPAGPTALSSARRLDEVGIWAAEVEDIAAHQGKGAEVWLGETGNAQCGGEPGVSSAFAGTLWWLDELGVLSRRGEKVVVRQTLAGSDYGLLDDVTLAPRPDYWGSVLWKRLMGTRVLSVASDAREGAASRVRMYAHCTPSPAKAGSVTVLAINHSRLSPARVHLPDFALGRFSTYLLEAGADGPSSIRLEGRPLGLEASFALPSLAGTAHAAGDGAPVIDLPPASLAFVVAEDAGAAACLAPRP